MDHAYQTVKQYELHSSMIKGFEKYEFLIIIIIIIIKKPRKFRV